MSAPPSRSVRPTSGRGPGALTTWELLKGLVKVALSMGCSYAVTKVVSLWIWKRRQLQRFLRGPKVHAIWGNSTEIKDEGLARFLERVHKEHGPVVRFCTGPFGFHVSISDLETALEVCKLNDSRPKTEPETEQSQLDTFDSKNRARLARLLVLNRDGKDVMASALEEMERKLDQCGADLVELDWMVFKVCARLYMDYGKADDKLEKLFAIQRYVREHEGDVKNYRLAMQDWRNELDTFVEERRKELIANPEKYKMSPLTRLICEPDPITGKTLSKRAIVSILIGFLNHGYRKVYEGIIWLLYDCGRNQGTQQKLLSEFLSRGSKPGEAIVDQLDSSFQFLDLVVKESLRLHSDIILKREIKQDIIVGGGMYRLASGTIVHMPLSVIFRNPTYFGAMTNKFIPERFANITNKSMVQMGAFGTPVFGYRSCCGQQIAPLQLKAIVHSLLMKYHISISSPNDAATVDEARQTLVFQKRRLHQS